MTETTTKRIGAAPSPRWLAVAQVAREHPGQWCLVARDMLVVYRHQIQTGRISAFRPAGTFKAAIRNGDGIRGDLLIRFIPESERNTQK